MATKKGTVDFEEGKRRLEEIGRRVGNLFGKAAGPKEDHPHPTPPPRFEGEVKEGVTGFLGRLGTLIEQLGELAAKAEEAGGEVTQTGEFGIGSEKRLRGVYGFTVKTGLGEKGLTVEPFGNISKEEESGRIVVKEIREPMTDLFDEQDHILIVAELPGIVQEDIRLELRDDILTLAAERGEKKYRKEVLLPAGFSPDKMIFTCRNGILEITLHK